jgi:hypothetical protein
MRQSNSLWPHLLTRRAIAIALCATSVVAFSSISATAASAGTTNVLKLSGGLNGTLKVNPHINCQSIGPTGAQLSWDNTKLSSAKPADWALNILTKDNGTFTKFGGSTIVTLTTINLEGWVATKGSVTLKGKTINLNVTLGAFESGAKGVTALKGSVNCG